MIFSFLMKNDVYLFAKRSNLLIHHWLFILRHHQSHKISFILKSLVFPKMMSFSSQTIKPLQFNNNHYSLNFLIRLFEQKLKIFQQPQNKSPRKNTTLITNQPIILHKPSTLKPANYNILSHLSRLENTLSPRFNLT